jgi:hypothetical protein
MKAPNFLFIITDQQRADHLGCYGNSIVRTPHIDALARAGFRAEQGHTPDHHRRAVRHTNRCGDVATTSTDTGVTGSERARRTPTR